MSLRADLQLMQLTGMQIHAAVLVHAVITMGALLGVDHALASRTGRQARLGGPPKDSTSSEPGNRPNPGPDPTNPPPTRETLRKGWWSS